MRGSANRMRPRIMKAIHRDMYVISCLMLCSCQESVRAAAEAEDAPYQATESAAIDSINGPPPAEDPEELDLVEAEFEPQSTVGWEESECRAPPRRMMAD